jgi:hypothetical protein
LHKHQVPRRHEDTEFLENESLDTIFDDRDIEIDQESEAFSSQFQMTWDLSLPHCIHRFNSLKFADHKVFNQHVQTQRQQWRWQSLLPLLKEACTSFHSFVTSRLGGKKALDWTQKYVKLSRGARTIAENLPGRRG